MNLFYVRELPQKQYHCQSYDYPVLPAKYNEIKPGDKWCSIWADYYIDKVGYSKNYLKIYATKIPLSKARKNTCYRRNKS